MQTKPLILIEKSNFMTAKSRIQDMLVVGSRCLSMRGSQAYRYGAYLFRLISILHAYQHFGSMNRLSARYL